MNVRQIAGHIQHSKVEGNTKHFGIIFFKFFKHRKSSFTMLVKRSQKYLPPLFRSRDMNNANFSVFFTLRNSEGIFWKIFSGFRLKTKQTYASVTFCGRCIFFLCPVTFFLRFGKNFSSGKGFNPKAVVFILRFPINDKIRVIIVPRNNSMKNRWFAVASNCPFNVPSCSGFKPTYSEVKL